MSDDPILAAIAQLGADLRGEIAAVRADLTVRVGNRLTAMADDIAVSMETAAWSRWSGDTAQESVQALGNVVEAMQR